MKAMALAMLTVFAAGSALAQSNEQQPASVAQIKAVGTGTTVNGTALKPGQVADLHVGDVVTVSHGQGMVGYGACSVRVPAGQAFTVSAPASACPAGAANSAVGTNATASWPYIVGGIGAAAVVGAAASGGGSSKPRPSSP